MEVNDNRLTQDFYSISKDLLGLNKKEYNHLIHDNISKIPIDTAYRICDKLNLDLISFAKNSFDKKTAFKYLLGDKYAIPPKYDNYNQSKIKTIKNTYEFSMETLGPYKTERIRRKFQLSKEILYGDENRKISGLLLIDLFEELQSEGIPQESFFQVGYRASQEFKSIITRNLPKKRLSPLELYENIILCLGDTVEKNLLYKIEKINRQRLIFSATTRKGLKDRLHINHFGSIPHSYNIMGWYAGLLRYAYQQDAKVKKLSCAYSGDPHCLYEVDYSHVSRYKVDYPKMVETP